MDDLKHPSLHLDKLPLLLENDTAFYSLHYISNLFLLFLKNKTDKKNNFNIYVQNAPEM